MLDYSQAHVIIERLEKAHDPRFAKIRVDFFAKEFSFLSKSIRGGRVLVAGSGLGQDAFVLALCNKEVVGVELTPELIEYAERERQKFGLINVKFVQGDMNNLSSFGFFDTSVLNMGTIGDFESTIDRQKIIGELLVHSNELYLDFYPPTETGLNIREKMYKEEGWINVRIQGKAVVSDDGLYSTSLTREEFIEIADSLGVSVRFYSFCVFSDMAIFTKKHLFQDGQDKKI